MLALNGFLFEQEKDWLYRENLTYRNIIHIIGGGHVGLALSQTMAQLGFYVKIYDDRPGLSTMEQNQYAHEKIWVDYERGYKFGVYKKS